MRRASAISHRRLERLPESELLGRRICDLDLRLDGTMAGAQARGLYRDLARAGLRHFRPVIYLGDEWFSPDGVPAIAMPFYLAHPRLKALEAERMREVEGGTRTWCRQLLRHEAGHCFDHAYRVSRDPEWRALFGSRRRRYDPDAYVADPTSRDFVIHLPGHYAQAHPDEDFAETFAVCITPDYDWRKAYRRWPKALAKLEYVSQLIAFYADIEPRVSSGPLDYAAGGLRSTLASYYARRQREARQASQRLASRH